MTSLMWFRRDLRLTDQPALAAASEQGEVAAVVVLDPRQLSRAGDRPRARFLASVHALSESMEGALIVRAGDPTVEIPKLVRELAVDRVFSSTDFTPFGAQRDQAVRTALGEVSFEQVGSPYAVAPGRVRKNDGSPYRVFTPYYKAWLAHGWRQPAPDVYPKYVTAKSDALPSFDRELLHGPVGEQTALARFEQFLAGAIADYGHGRDFPGIDGTSLLSPALRFGEVHPRSLLARLGDEDGHAKFRSEICWREFYADVLHHNPDATVEPIDVRFAHMLWDEGADAEARFEAWKTGNTGYPIVDAGMRQLLSTGWMHNRVRMIVASFLIKHLHISWQQGAAFFMQHLLDGDTASNSLSWQWVAGCGTDAAPFFRIFNPVLQGYKFDPDGNYVRQYVPELREVAGGDVHEPWKLGGVPGYAEPIIDLGVERAEALRRLELLS